MTPSKRPHAAPPAAARAGTYRYDNLLQAAIRRRQAMAAERAVSPAYVREVILPDLDRHNGHAGRWAVADQAIKGRDSWIFRADSPQAPFPLALKVYSSA